MQPDGNFANDVTSPASSAATHFPASMFQSDRTVVSGTALKQRAAYMRSGIKIDYTRNELFTEFGRATLEGSYLLQGEDYQDGYARVAGYYADDAAHAQRLYDYMSKHWFSPATPVLSNGGTNRGLPISCFLNAVEDSIKDIQSVWDENIQLAKNGGGIGTYWGAVRSMGEKVGNNGETSGIIPFIKVQDSMTLAISQGSLRRGSAAIYIPIDHPEIEEFLNLRRATGGDPDRKAINLHNAIAITDEFMRAVDDNADFALRSPKDRSVIRTIKARELWQQILQIRMETGEPYLLFIDTVNRAAPAHHKKLGLSVKQSNLCAEITLPTGIDHKNMRRTAVCCLSSLNIERFDEWGPSSRTVVKDVLRFLDNVLQDFIETADPVDFRHSIYSARAERSVGLGVMGFHSYLQQQGIAFESEAAREVNRLVFTTISAAADLANEELGMERGPCQDSIDAGGVPLRFSNMTAIAPTASISIICGTTSPACETWSTNGFLQKTKHGNFIVKNKYLTQLLESIGENNADSWKSILAEGGSVQHLSCLTLDQKAIFKTSFEIDQRWAVKHTAERQPYISQSQSLNVFLPADVDKQELNELHMLAWEQGVKSMYYCRSKSLQRAENVSSKVARFERPDAVVAAVAVPAELTYETCEACQ